MTGIRQGNQYCSRMKKNKLDENIRQKILKNPDLVLLDQEIFMSLINETNFSDDANIVDIRNIFLKRLGSKLEKLKNANNKILKHAYENQLSVSKIHRCCLSVLDSKTIQELFMNIFDEFPVFLKINSIKFVLEKTVKFDGDIKKIIYASQEELLSFSKFVGITQSRLVILREDLSYKHRSNLGLDSSQDNVESEAILSIKIKNKGLGFIFLESNDKKTFSIDQATDYLEFLCKIISNQIENLS